MEIKHLSAKTTAIKEIAQFIPYTRETSFQMKPDSF